MSCVLWHWRLSLKTEGKWRCDESVAWESCRRKRGRKGGTSKIVPGRYRGDRYLSITPSPFQPSPSTPFSPSQFDFPFGIDQEGAPVGLPFGFDVDADIRAQFAGGVLNVVKWLRLEILNFGVCDPPFFYVIIALLICYQ